MADEIEASITRAYHMTYEDVARIYGCKNANELLLVVDDIHKQLCRECEKSKKLRYERLMAKAAYWKDVDISELYWKHRHKSWLMFCFQCERIARAYEARAERIKEQM